VALHVSCCAEDCRKMKIIIAGSRYFTDVQDVRDAAAQCGFDITEVVSGAARGVDQLGEQWAKEHSIRVKQFCADWYEQGLKAGMLRNAAMAGYADGLLAIWDGKSKGTADMIRKMRFLCKPVFIYYPDEPL